MLYQRVITVVCCVLFVLIVWTIIDPLRDVEERSMSASGSELDSVVTSNTTCRCDYYYIWKFMGIGGHGVLLLMASVLAFQSRQIDQAFNESRSLGTMIYSHFMFLILRIVVVVMDASFSAGIFPATIIAAILSFLYSLDTLAAVCIYIIPKLLRAAGSKDGSDDNMYASSQRLSSPMMHQTNAVSEIERQAKIARKTWIANKISTSASVPNNSQKFSFVDTSRSMRVKIAPLEERRRFSW